MPIIKENVQCQLHLLFKDYHRDSSIPSPDYPNNSDIIAAKEQHLLRNNITNDFGVTNTSDSFLNIRIGTVGANSLLKS